VKEQGPDTLGWAARVLVVDDDDASLRLVERVLGMSGFPRPTLVADPRTLVQVCAEHVFDVVLLDLAMPHLDGWQVVGLLEASYGDQTPPVIVVTADARRSVQVKALSLGACDFIAKPFDVSELLVRIRKHARAHLTSRLLQEQKSVLEAAVDERTQEVRRSRLEVMQLLGRAAEFRDNETGAHILRMSHVSALLARRMGWSAADCELMLNASPLHDIGKIGIPDSILLKPGPLDADERKRMETHTVKGAAILCSSGNEMIRLAAEIALSHHEKWDGTGYPQGLAADAIPQSARIVAVADIFDALTSQRPYKGAWPTARAVDYIRQQSGRHLDPAVVDAFSDSIDDALRLSQQFRDEPVHGAD
jgi:putative two-component system response regulator